MKEIVIKVDDKQYTRIISAAAKRRTTPSMDAGQAYAPAGG